MQLLLVTKSIWIRPPADAGGVGAGQARLKDKSRADRRPRRAGSPLALYLAGAGVGRSGSPMAIPWTPATCRARSCSTRGSQPPKAELARERLSQHNPLVGADRHQPAARCHQPAGVCGRGGSGDRLLRQPRHPARPSTPPAWLRASPGSVPPQWVAGQLMARTSSDHACYACPIRGYRDRGE